MLPHPFTTLVVGATGATGRHVVRQLLLEQPHHRVICLVRSRAALLRALHDASSSGPPVAIDNNPRLTIYEGSVLDWSDAQLCGLVGDKQVDAIVSCLGHNLTWLGFWGPPRRLVTDSLKRLVGAVRSPAQQSDDNNNQMNNKKTVKLLLMNTAGVYVPHVDDDPRTTTSRTERFVFWLLRNLLPPHADNEAAAAYLYQELSLEQQQQEQQQSTTNRNPIIQWVVVRPTNLINDDDKASSSSPEYKLMDRPPTGGVLFGPQANTVVSRRNVARFMVDLLTDDTLFARYQCTFPVIHNQESAADPATAALAAAPPCDNDKKTV